MADDARKVVTITLNPSLEQTALVHYMAVGYRNPMEGNVRFDPAGKGVSIALALHHMGGAVHAIIAIGDDSAGRTYKELISSLRLPASFVLSSHHTRSRFIIFDTANNVETELVEAPPVLSENDLVKVEATLRGVVQPDDLVVIAGSLPDGLPTSTYARLIAFARSLKARVVLATRGIALEESVEAQPNLVVLRQKEIEAYFNYPIRNIEDIFSAARKVRERGAERVLITTEALGQAILVTESQEWLGDFPVAGEGTSSGKWEAMIAGYLMGRVQDAPLDQALALGSAAALYTASQVGNEFGSLEDIQELQNEINVEPVDDKADQVR